MTSPEVATDTLERILQRQAGHIPMTPRDIEMMRTAIQDLRIHRMAELRHQQAVKTDNVVAMRRARA